MGSSAMGQGNQDFVMDERLKRAEQKAQVLGLKAGSNPMFKIPRYLVQRKASEGLPGMTEFISLMQYYQIRLDTCIHTHNWPQTGDPSIKSHALAHYMVLRLGLGFLHSCVMHPPGLHDIQHITVTERSIRVAN